VEPYRIYTAPATNMILPQWLEPPLSLRTAPIKYDHMKLNIV